MPTVIRVGCGLFSPGASLRERICPGIYARRYRAEPEPTAVAMPGIPWPNFGHTFAHLSRRGLIAADLRSRSYPVWSRAVWSRASLGN